MNGRLKEEKQWNGVEEQGEKHDEGRFEQLTCGKGGY